MTRVLFAFIALVTAVALLTSTPAQAQSGMSLATAKQLMADLLDAGYEPSIRKRVFGSGYVVSVSTGAGGPTAQQVQNFATNRGVTARVFAVEFE